ncbi:hypothetical protein FNV64_30955 [Streptomyces sp. S1A1-7]|nr:hypothetical protein FNV64_30955 [Streptomyces sp. S1A1-7]
MCVASVRSMRSVGSVGSVRSVGSFGGWLPLHEPSTHARDTSQVSPRTIRARLSKDTVPGLK